MNKYSNVIAVVLIIVGVVFLSYTGYTYSTQEKVAQIGSLKITSETEKTIPFSPIVGGICLVFGIALLVFNKRNR
jgi:TRAP-type C4-dicarboxylate transport system permease small subunit